MGTLQWELDCARSASDAQSFLDARGIRRAVRMDSPRDVRHSLRARPTLEIIRETMAPTVIDPAQVPERRGTRVYPAEFRRKFEGRVKQALGDALGLQNFGVNLVRLEPGAWSSVRHWHARQDEFIYVLEGHPTLRTDAGEQILAPGMAAGFPAGRPDGHQVINKTKDVVVFLEIGDRTPDDVAHYPDYGTSFARPTGR